jgi:nucleotide-binding universal stress UspA family protein
MFRKVLIAVDGSPVSTHAAEVGTALAHSAGAEVAFVHAVDPSEAYGPETGLSAPELMAEAEREGRRLLAAHQQRAGGTPSPLGFEVVGKAAPEIVRAAREWPADVVVVGSHGRSGAGRVLLGSVAEAVVRHAPCPVLVVRGAG